VSRTRASSSPRYIRAGTDAAAKITASDIVARKNFPTYVGNLERQYEDDDLQKDSGGPYQCMAVFESGNGQKEQDHAKEPCISRPNPGPLRPLFFPVAGATLLLSAHDSSLEKSTGYMGIDPKHTEGFAVGKWSFSQIVAK